MKVEIKGNELVITMPIEKPFVPSKSGKSDTVATSRGVKETGVIIDGRPLFVGVNTFLKK